MIVFDAFYALYHELNPECVGAAVQEKDLLGKKRKRLRPK